MKPYFKAADIKDARNLTAISIAAFHTDFMVAGRSAKGGPPGYDSVAFHERMIKEATKFFKILVGDEVIGGFWFNREKSGNAYLYRVFIDPQFHRKGIGLDAFNFLFENYPDIKTWTLKVPIWNTRTPEFYKKLGFKVVNQSERFLFFEK